MAEEGNQVKGFILFNIENRKPWFRIKKIGYIDIVIVEKKSRGKGISRLLTNKACEILKKEGIDYLKLSVQTDNRLAHKIWKKQGFKDYRVDMFKKL